MDRKSLRIAARVFLLMVALRKESVDRKWLISSVSTAAVASLSARRAWIEKWHCLPCPAACHVALRKESVDRKSAEKCWAYCNVTSLSARRAWIEKLTAQLKRVRYIVALRKESVDRNFGGFRVWVWREIVALRKESVDRNLHLAARPFPVRRGSLSARRAWIEITSCCLWRTRTRCRSPQGEHGMFLFLTVQGGFVHADIRFNFKNCYSKKLSHKII